MKRLVSIIGLLMGLACISSLAQVKVDVPPVVDVNEQFKVEFSLNEKPASFDWSPSDDFKLVWGPQQGRSSSTTMVNGKTTSTSKYSFSYVLLPKKAGSFVLPSCTAVVDGKILQSPVTKIEVVESSAASAQEGNSGSAGKSSGTSFLKLSLNKKKVKVGEPVIATLKLYTQENISGFDDAHFPSFNGFWSEDTVSPQNIEFVRENVDGQIFNAALLRRWTLLPQQSGTLKIDAAEIICVIRESVSSGDPFFDGFFDNYTTKRKRLSSQELKLSVAALPLDAPASFNGAVGKFNISAKISSDSLTMHESAYLTLTISGTGNVSMLTAPKVKFPPDSEEYDVKVTDNTKGTTGSKVFEYPFIPRSYGDFTISPVEFSYYNPSTDKYVTVSTPEISFNVAKPSKPVNGSGEAVATVSSVHKSEVKNLATEIKYLTTRLPKFTEGVQFFLWSPVFFLLVAMLILCAVASAVSIHIARSRRADIVGSRVRGASKLATKRLSTAKSFLQKGQQSDYYEELHKALLGYVSHKLNISGSELSKDSIASMLASRGIDQTLVDEYLALLDLCEFARYSPQAGDSAMKESYDKAISVISSIDSKMKKTPSAKTASAVTAMALMLCTGLGMNAQSQSIDSLWYKAKDAYDSKDFTQAVQLYQQISDQNMVSAELYYNIGNAYFKDDELGKAILYYERALKLDPSHSDASYNLSLAQSQMVDKVTVMPELYTKKFFRKLAYSLSSDTWTWIFVVLFALALASVLIYLFSYRKAWKITGFFTSIAAVLLSVWCICNANIQRKAALSSDKAIVTCSVSEVRSAPDVTNTTLFEIHEGTAVFVVDDSLVDWVKIRIEDGREGWISVSDISVI